MERGRVHSDKYPSNACCPQLRAIFKSVIMLKEPPYIKSLLTLNLGGCHYILPDPIHL